MLHAVRPEQQVPLVRKVLPVQSVRRERPALMVLPDQLARPDRRAMLGMSVRSARLAPPVWTVPLARKVIPAQLAQLARLARSARWVRKVHKAILVLMARKVLPA